MKTNYM